jgi:hypothetical protein
LSSFAAVPSFSARVAAWPVVRSPRAVIVVCAVVAAALRLPFLFSGIGMDEGGYAYVASRWASGGHLYHDAWVDRPQGLMLVYRWLLDLGHAPWAIRLAMLLAGVGITVLLGIIGWLLLTPWTGAAAAALYAVIGVGPHIEGFTFNGELAAALPATAAIAAALWWKRCGRKRWLLAAGLAGGVALTMKQSGFDGLAVALVIAAATPSSRLTRRAERVGIVLAGAAAPLVASALHGLLTGWHAYWYAVVGWRLNAAAGGSRPLGLRLQDLAHTLPNGRADLWALALLAVLGAWSCARHPGLRRLVPLAWVAAAFAAFNVGGLYWPHYWVQMVPPLALLGGAGAGALPRRGAPWSQAPVALAITPVILALISLASLPSPLGPDGVAYAYRSSVDERVADYVDAHTPPRSPIYALVSEADLYFLAGRPSPYPYLWEAEVQQIPGAMARLERTLASPSGPRLVLVYTPATSVDRSGRLERVLVGHYRPVRTFTARGLSVVAMSRRHTEGAQFAATPSARSPGSSPTNRSASRVSIAASSACCSGDHSASRSAMALRRAWTRPS